MAERQAKPHSLTSEQASFIESCVHSGRFGNASEVVRAALRLLQEQEARTAAVLDGIREALRTGLEQADRGELHDGPSVMADVREFLRQRAEPEADSA